MFANQPDYCSCPGATVSELMIKRKISITEMAKLCDCFPETFCGFLEGKIELWSGLSEKLEEIFNIPADFWVKRDKHYWEYFSWNNRIKRKIHSIGNWIEECLKSYFP